MGDLKTSILTFSKAQFSSWVSSGVDFCVTILLTEVFDVWYGTSTFIGAISGGITNCIINYKWVFHAMGMKKKNVALKYMLVWVVSIALNTGGTYMLTELTGVNFIAVKAVVAILVAIFWNYQMQRTFVFRKI